MNEFYELFDSLDDQQHQAAVETDESTLVLAGAGSGKTRTLVAKAAVELEAHPVYVMTFTVSAAEEIQTRLESILRGDEDRLKARLRHVGTLHSWCLGVLRCWGEESRELADETTLAGVMAETAKRLRIKTPQNRQRELVAGAEPVNAAERMFSDTFRKDMAEHGLLSYDGILQEAAALLRRESVIRPGAIFLIDEAQDSSVDDLAIYHELLEAGAQLWMVGDLQQAIYSFRHPTKADVWNWCLDRELLSCQLETNYRSSEAVIKALNLINASFTPRVEAVPAKGAAKGEVKLIRSESEGELIAKLRGRIAALQAKHGSKPEEFAVLCRTNRECELLAKMLGTEFELRTKCPVPEVPERLWAALGFYRQPESDWAARRYLRSIGADDVEASKDARWKMQALGYRIMPTLFAIERTPSEWRELMNLLQVPKREQGWFYERLGEGWTELSWDEIMLRLFEAREQPEQGSGVTVTTVHSAKGREWRHVLMPFCDQYSYRPKNGVEEERVFFVGASRAIETLSFLFAHQRVDEFRGSMEVAMCPSLERIVEAKK